MYSFLNLLVRTRLSLSRVQVEGHVQPGKAALLWRAGEAESAAPRALPWLQIQTAAQTDLHRGGTEAESGRVQGHDEEP